jgi:acetolactate synthase-1/2/3 large subunit
MAKGLGAHGERVERLDELEPALARAQANLPAVVDVLVTRDADSPDFLSGLATVPAYQALSSWDRAERRLRGL